MKLYRYIIILFQKKISFLLISYPLLAYIKIIEINEVYPFLCNYFFIRKIYRI